VIVKASYLTGTDNKLTMIRIKSPESGDLEQKDPLYVAALKAAMDEDGLSLEEAYTKFKEEILATDSAVDSAIPEHLKELERALEMLRQRGK